MDKDLLLKLIGMAISEGPTAPQTTEQGKWFIVILQRGWVVVGRLHDDGGPECRLEDSSVIRKWGTTKGIGELALNGPLADTKLDKCGTVRFNKGAEVCKIDCKTDNWS